MEINLRTLKMQRAKSQRCDNSYVALYQGTTLESDRRARICNDDKPEVMSVTSNRNRVFVRLYGNSLDAKPELEMVYSLVKTGSCNDGDLSCGDFCIARNMRCNGVTNCPDGRDERGCPRITPPRPHPGGGSHPPVVDDVDENDIGGGAGSDVANGASGSGGSDKGDSDSEGATKIPLHTIILGVIGGVLLTCVVFGLCIMCRSRRQEKRRKKKEEMKMNERNKRSILEVPTSSAHHPTLSRQTESGKDGRGGQKSQGQGHPQGRYMTFAQVNPSAKDNPNRYSFTGTNLPQQTELEGGVDMSESGVYRRYLNLEMTPDELEDPSTCPPLYSQGVVLGMTHLPSPTTPVSPSEGGVYGLKYSPQSGQWTRAMIEDPTLVYPYTSSLPRPTPFLGVSKPFPQNAESKYLKSMQALKSMDNEIMKENPTS
nr:hypothetical protein BaRGS_017896 [Batillaria attramentaria]